MARGLTRRHVLWGAATALVSTRAVGQPVPDREPRASARFTPVVHGFGFRNWSPESQYFDLPPTGDPNSIETRIRTGWREQSRAVLDMNSATLPAPLLEALATNLRVSIAHFAGTNGHCYGMVLAAQQYFDHPETIPVDRGTASEIEDPTIPLDRPETPVYQDIVRLQADQFLRFRAWLGRRALVHPEWIDTDAVLRDVRSVVERFGTASLLLFSERLYGHQVLAYGYVDHGDEIEVSVYDPNRTAGSYRHQYDAVWFDRGREGVTMRPYQQYTGVLFNRYDRIERLPDREHATPFDHLLVERETVRSSLFPLALVLVDVDAVDLVVLDPDGDPLERLRGVNMDCSRGEAARMRTRYGAPPGSYQISVFGTRTTDYELQTIVSGLDGEIVNATHTARIATGEVHEYELEIPARGAGSVTRSNRPRRPAGFVAGAGAIGGLAAGFAGYRILSRRNREKPGQSAP